MVTPRLSRRLLLAVPKTFLGGEGREASHKGAGAGPAVALGLIPHPHRPWGSQPQQTETIPIS